MNILVTGGTGSFGQHLIRTLLETNGAEKVIVYSRDELKQLQMRQQGLTDERLRYFIGDVRDLQRLRRAMRDADVVVHAAALKQVDSCEYNPQEAVKTNIGGTSNVIEAALDCDVQKVLMVGTDKAVDPVNLYGATKLTAEKLIVDANVYSGADGPAFSSTRYGNVITSRGAVLPLFLEQHAAGRPLTVTDKEMTRFVLTLDQSVQFVLGCLARMRGGEVFVPDIPSVPVMTIARAVAWPNEPTTMVIGRRAGEKLHELLISANESQRVVKQDGLFVIGPDARAGVFGQLSSDRVRHLSVAEFRALAGLGATLEEAAS